MRSLATVWTKHLKDKTARDNFEKLLRGNVTVNQRIVNLLNEKLESNKPRVTDYDSPSWAFRQADQNGYDRAMRELLELFNFMTPEK